MFTAVQVLVPSRLTSLAGLVRVLCAIACGVLLAGSGFYVSAQQAASTNSVAHVAVTDAANRFVTGLEQRNFEVNESGVLLPFRLLDAQSPASIAIVGVPPPDITGDVLPDDELITATNAPDAVRELMASKNMRKIMILTVAADTQNLPDNIQVFRADARTVPFALREIHKDYLIEFSPSGATSSINVRLKSPNGLPPLRLLIR